ncbi:hypothetical protein SAMN05216198_0632 [Halopseudomonas litoralis]|uniref:Uncharacterized protein n=1 Tax=Halopseudomonas litoralis TaxID=797277 RepID=A0A1H1MIX3_9GAMM|nr:hypothetical protein [Halopseudomonas litoralis]SDR86784.1 hypothetical protein SAMN05216198_0632 [Halopseudomonas litoralis]
MFAPANTAYFTLDIPRLDHDFKVLFFQGTEAISQPYCFELDLAVLPRQACEIEHAYRTGQLACRKHSHGCPRLQRQRQSSAMQLAIICAAKQREQ